MFKNANILVAGGTGFIGTNLIIRLSNLGANVRATIHEKNPNIIGDHLLNKNSKIEYIKCNLLDKNDCEKVTKNMDYVFMCAANTSGAAVMKSTPLVHVTPNIIMNSQMLEASYTNNVKKFIFISSSAAYPPSGNTPIMEHEMFNADPYDAYFGVGWMKRYTEILCKLYSEKLKESMKTLVVRPSNVYGTYDKFDPTISHVMAATIRKVVERQNPIQIWGTGNDIRDFIYIDDFIDGLLLATEKINKFEAINIASGIGYSVKDILKITLNLENYNDAYIIYDNSKPSMIPIMLVNTEKAERLLKFKANISIEEGIKETIEWYRRNYNDNNKNTI